jgi:hypothetical protein
MKRISPIALVFALLVFCSFARGQQTSPLNTGYDHSVPGPYMTVSIPISNRQDMYWINLATYPATTPPTGPSWVLKFPGAPWAPAMTYTSGSVTWGSSWIGARKTVDGGGSTLDNTGYSIFKKCFCLLPGFNNAFLSFKALTDDKASFYLNTIPNSLGTVSGNAGGPAFSGGTNNQNYFHVGKNCFFVYLEDQGGWMGFDLVGEIKANGLLPMVAASWNGTDISFEPCPCSNPTPTSPRPGMPNSARVGAQAEYDDQQVINELVKFAEARRTAKQKIQDQRKEPKK